MLFMKASQNLFKKGLYSETEPQDMHSCIIPLQFDRKVQKALIYESVYHYHYL